MKLTFAKCKKGYNEIITGTAQEVAPYLAAGYNVPQVLAAAANPGDAKGVTTMLASETALSVLNTWSGDPKANTLELKRYIARHGWLRADVEKLSTYIREFKLRKVAITDRCIYDVNTAGTICITARANLRIPPNFS